MDTSQLLSRVVATLATLGVKATTRPRPRGAPNLPGTEWLRIGRGGTHMDYAAQTKSAVTPATVGAVLMQLRKPAAAAGSPVLLLAEHFSSSVAETLREEHQQFADAAGNAYLDAPGVYVYAVGRKAENRPTAHIVGRAFNPAGLKTVFALLCNPVLAGGPQRGLAAAANVALGAIPGVLADLQREGHLLVAGRNRRFDPTRVLLDEWAAAYARRLRPKTLVRVYSTSNFNDWPSWKLPTGARWGGEPAAHRFVRHLKPGVLTIYAEALPPRFLVEQRFIEVDRENQGQLIEHRRPFWGDTLHLGASIDIVPPVLAYADLLATGDGRCIETAQMIYEAHLARSIRQV